MKIWIRCFAGIALVVMVGACGDIGYDERVQFLREASSRGVEVHNLLAAQNTIVTDEACRGASNALNSDAPDVATNDPDQTERKAWTALVEQTFMKACVAGEY
jgi:hypothetical protein